MIRTLVHLFNNWTTTEKTKWQGPASDLIQIIYLGRQKTSPRSPRHSIWDGSTKWRLQVIPRSLTSSPTFQVHQPWTSHTIPLDLREELKHLGWQLGAWKERKKCISHHTCYCHHRHGRAHEPSQWLSLCGTAENWSIERCLRFFLLL